jgi:hypothetical protein
MVYSPSAYEHRKLWMSHTKTNEYKYPCVHSTPKTGVRYMYSKVNDKGHFGVPKVIFGEAGINDVIIDINGEYGLTNGAIGIKINSIDPETLKIDFSVAENNSNWSNKKGRSTIDDIINLLNYESMYGIQDFREHYLKFLQKTIL